MERLTFEGDFCDISQCTAIPCQLDNNCAQKQVWERLKEYEDIGFTPDAMRQNVETLRDIEEMWARAPMLEAYEAYVDGRLVILPKTEGGGLDFLRECSTVDAVEVVRCRDCKHYHPDEGWCDEHSHFITHNGGFCHPWESSNWKMFPEDHYCADGERKRGTQPQREDV